MFIEFQNGIGVVNVNHIFKLLLTDRVDGKCCIICIPHGNDHIANLGTYRSRKTAKKVMQWCYSNAQQFDIAMPTEDEAETW